MLMTRWGQTLDRTCPLPEYPRPQFARDSYFNLNGVWEYAMWGAERDFGGWQGEIVVPFSPEAQLSGVGKTLAPDQVLYYRRTIHIPPDFLKDTTLLHFGAVDSSCTVRLNSEIIGTHHGGFTPFHFDVSTSIHPGDNELIVEVTDPTDTSWVSRGKQSTKPGGIWYTAQSGIWQTVWLESLPTGYLESVRIEPDINEELVRVTPTQDCLMNLDGHTYDLIADQPNDIPVAKPNLWTPENPHLYDIEFTAGDDTVRSYFGMRSFGIERDDRGYPRLMLNNRAYFQHGLLDQGYWPDGLLTPPSDEAMLHDIRLAKRLGFNMLRKHIKIEPARWYWHCDREGILVWQDMINGGTRYNPLVTQVLPFLGIRLKDNTYSRFGQADRDSRQAYYRELDEMLNALMNCVSISVWVPFNEGWGQFDANAAVDHIRTHDSSRIIEHASGWHDQGGGDVRSLHVYFRKVRPPKPDGRTFALTEFGGYSHAVSGHVWNPGKVFGYKIFGTEDAWKTGFEKLYRDQVIPLVDQGLSATIYTQLTDIEDEVNGLVTYDREVCKLDEELGLSIAEALHKDRAEEIR